MAAPQIPVIASTPADFPVPTDNGKLDPKAGRDDKHPGHSSTQAVPGVDGPQNQRMESYMGDAILRFLRIRIGPRVKQDPDAVRTRSHTHSVMEKR